MAPQVISKVKPFELFQFIATKKSSLSDWSYMYIRITPERLGEALQILSFYMQGSEILLAELRKESHLLVLVPVKKNMALYSFQKEIAENFHVDAFFIEIRDLSAKNLRRMAEVITPLISSEDHVSILCLQRMVRFSTSIMLLDDDVTNLNLMEKSLKRMGNVIISHEPAAFIEEYKKHAPDIIFLNIHLEGAVSGIDILGKLLKEVDPYAQVVMISGDTQETTVRKLAGKGAKGLVMKPLKKDVLLNFVINAPTFVLA